jgi:hypothetical protein
VGGCLRLGAVANTELIMVSLMRHLYASGLSVRKRLGYQTHNQVIFMSAAAFQILIGATRYPLEPQKNFSRHLQILQ